MPTAIRLARNARRLLCGLAALPLAGCYTVDRTIPTASVPDDYHLRHPVVLANAPERLDIFMVPADGRLDRRQVRDLEVFAHEYLTQGQSGVVIRAPVGPVDPAAVDRTVNAVRRVLYANGVRGAVQIGTYPVSDPQLASPLHVSYVKLQARLASRCGDWPSDLASGASTEGWDNKTFYNLGCASSKTFAAQIDDPRDLVRGRAEEPTDVQLRTRAIGQLRYGNSPSTNWGGSPTPIGQVGSF